MSLLGIAALAGVAYAMYKGGSVREGEAYPDLDEKELDEHCARYGIMYGLGNEKIRKIAARNGIRYKNRQYKILPEVWHHQDRYLSEYIEKYALDQSEIDGFYKEWNKYNEKMKKQQNYEKWRDNRFQNSIESRQYKNKTCNQEFVITIEHWKNINKKECKNRMITIQKQLKDKVIEEPILRQSKLGWHETWVIKASSKEHAENMYNLACLDHGWLP